MCYHKRIIYTSCGHSGWAAEVRACEFHPKNKNRSSSTSCDTMYSHPFHTLRVEKFCGRCIINRENTSEKVLKVREWMKDLKSDVDRLRKGRSGDGTDGMDTNDVGSVCSDFSSL